MIRVLTYEWSYHGVWYWVRNDKTGVLSQDRDAAVSHMVRRYPGEEVVEVPRPGEGSR